MLSEPGSVLYANKISFTAEELSVVVEALNGAKPIVGRRRDYVFRRVRGDLQLALATAMEDEEDGEG